MPQMELSKTTKDRLLKLCALLESLPKEADQHFNMVDWFEHRGKRHKHGLDDGDMIERKHLTACGTSACALGWATTLPYFRDLGLRMTYSKEKGGVISFDGMSGVEGGVFPIAKAAFEMADEQQAVLFFRDIGASTPKQWAAQVRQIIKQWDRSK